MRALVVYAHPKTESYSAAILEKVTGALSRNGAEYRVRDLYRLSFSPVLTPYELDIYGDEASNIAPVAEDVAALQWADTLIFVYPTWWYGLPAILKGWLDRVLVPGVAFVMPADGAAIRPGLTNITRMGVFTTCGASRWFTYMIGAPGKRTLLRGVRAICAPRCRTYYAAHYRMDASTPRSRARHLARVEAKMERLCG